MGNEFWLSVSIFHFLVSRAIFSNIKVRRVWSSFESEQFNNVLISPSPFERTSPFLKGIFVKPVD